MSTHVTATLNMGTMYGPTSKESITINNCGSIPFSVLLERLMKNDTAFYMLDLTNNDLSGGKFKQLIDVLKANTSVKSLILVSCKLEDSCVSTLMDLLYRDESLTFLDVTSNNISYESCNTLLRVAQDPRNPYEVISFKTVKLSVKTDFGDLDSSKIKMKDTAVRINHTVAKPTIDQSKHKSIEESNAKQRDIINAKSKIATPTENNGLTQAHSKEPNAGTKVVIPSTVQLNQSKIDELSHLVSMLLVSYHTQQTELASHRATMSAHEVKITKLQEENEGLKKEMEIMKDGSKLAKEREAIIKQKLDIIFKNPHLEVYYNFFKSSLRQKSLGEGLISLNYIVNNNRSFCSDGAQTVAKVTSGMPVVNVATAICAAGIDCGENTSNRQTATGLHENVGDFSDPRIEELAIEMTIARKEEIEKCSDSSNFTDSIKNGYAKAKGAPGNTPIKRLVESDIEKIFEIARKEDSEIKPSSSVKELVALLISTPKANSKVTAVVTKL